MRHESQVLSTHHETNIELRFHKTLESYYKSVIIPIYESQQQQQQQCS